MPRIASPLTRNSTGQTVAELHGELRKLGVPIPSTELTAKRYGDETEKAVRAFQRRYGLPESGTVDVSLGLLTGVASVAIDGNRPALRTAVREAAAAAVDASPHVNYLLARDAVRARDYQTAYTLAQRFQTYGPMIHVIGAVIGVPTQQPSAPDDPYPENFYAYRHQLLPRPALDQLRQNIIELSREQFAVDIHTTVPNIDLQQLGRAKSSAQIPLGALAEWQDGIRNSLHREFTLAGIHYDQCQLKILDYFKERYGSSNWGVGTLDERLALLWTELTRPNQWSYLWESLRWRRRLLSLRELFEHDWATPVGTDGVYQAAGEFVYLFYRAFDVGPDPVQAPRERRVEALLVTLAFIFVPLARAEDNRLRRQFDAALQDVDRLMKTYNNLLPPQYRFLCDFVEVSYLRLLKAAILLDKADAQFKARALVTPTDSFPEAEQYHSRIAAKTYLEIFTTFQADDLEQYVPHVRTARDRLKQKLDERIAQGDTDSRDFHALIKGVTIPNASSVGGTLPGLDRRPAPHERLVVFTTPSGQVVPETNPRVYALLLEAQARLEQLRADFNYFGYRDDYVPPWRFQFLLERARYFTEHAKNAQREYLNFLSNAEHEEFQELSAAQNVELEKSNVRIETARVDQVRFEVQVASESKKLAEQVAQNAHDRREVYQEFDEYADEVMNTEGNAALYDAMDYGRQFLNSIHPIVGALAQGWGDALTGGFFSSSKGKLVEAAQREMERHNLELAEREARQSAVVAAAQLAAAQVGLLVAGLQRQAALLRHEFALQNLNFMRNRILTSEQWYRLAGSIRSVSETYLRYAVEVSFQAEQAYEFELDKGINVIRFDYDQSEVGDFLAADFLLRDLDTLEQDLLVGQRQRQQQIRYVLSMAREFPETLQELRDKGSATFSVTLDQLERRFPGIFNMRIGAVDVLPVALLDSTRFSLELAYLGSSQVRLRSRPGASDLWEEQFRTRGPETVVYSGLSRQEAGAVFPFATSGQRNAFEGLGAASAWKIGMSMAENRVVPGTLADMLITFTLSGYYDATLRAHQLRRAPSTNVLTAWLSARQSFPDAFYDFSRTGRMMWKVQREMLALSGDLGRLRNLGVGLRPGAPNVHFSRLMTRLRANFRINENAGVASGVTVLTAIPETWVTQTAPLTVAVRARLKTATELAWDFGDGTPILRTVRRGTPPRIAPAEGTHVYAKPGRYTIKLRCVQDDSLSEHRIGVVVSRSQRLGDPLVIFLPQFSFDTNANTLTITTGGDEQQAARILWRVGDLTAEGTSATFKLRPGNYTLDFSAVRKLSFRAYGAQRYGKGLAPLPLQGFSATTNRAFDQSGKEIRRGTPPLPVRNELARRLFDKGEISPEDDWTFELIPEDILGVPAGTAIGAEQLDLSDIQDVVLSMEYDITPGAP